MQVQRWTIIEKNIDEDIFNYPNVFDPAKITVFDSDNEAPCYTGESNTQKNEEASLVDLIDIYNVKLKDSELVFDKNNTKYQALQWELSTLRRQTREKIANVGYENLTLEERLYYLNSYRRSKQAANEAYNIDDDNKTNSTIGDLSKFYDFKRFVERTEDTHQLQFF